MTSARQPLVIDASALLILLLDPGQRGEAVADRLRVGELHAPALLPFEVTNVLRRQRLAGRLSAAEAALAHDGAARLPVDLWPFEVVAARVIELGDVLTSYDASYVALAELLGATLVTADRRLARGPGTRCDVVAV